MLKSEEKRTIGSFINIISGRDQIVTVFFMSKRYGCNSPGPQMFSSRPSFAASLRRLFASLSSITVDPIYTVSRRGHSLRLAEVKNFTHSFLELEDEELEQQNRK